MRLIDADALVNNLSRKPSVNLFIHAKNIEAAIDETPIIDAEPVVRCKDCKHWDTGYGGETDTIKVCEYANYMVGENGYCVYGERKMDLEVQDD